MAAKDAGLDFSQEDLYNYVDIMMLGRTGMGKSTIGNKLLGVNPETYKPYKERDEIKQWGYDGDEKYFFETGDGKMSITKSCKVLSNREVRVLDTRGFADSELTKDVGVIQGNLQSFRWMLQAQREINLSFTRVLYFYPHRGPGERADGTLQEEIKVMYSYFGQAIFNIMVVIVTNHKHPNYQKAGFDKEQIDETVEAFVAAFKRIIAADKKKMSKAELKCPPVLYIPFNEDHTHILQLILDAPVVEEEYLGFSPEYPKDPSLFSFKNAEKILKYETSKEEKKKAIKQSKRKTLTFEDRCSRCAIKLVHERRDTGEEFPIAVIHANGDQESYDNSYCHPLFVPKFTRVEKIIGGIAHIVTLGMGRVYEYFTKNKCMPRFTSSEEICIKCRKPPGSFSCHPVNQPYKIAGKMEKIDHKRELDVVELMQEESRAD